MTRRAKLTAGVWPPGMAFLRGGAGEQLVFFPGLSGNPDPPTGVDLLLQRYHLAPFARGREVVWLNRRRTLAPPATIAEIAEDCAVVIRARLSPPVDLVGISTGGSVALQLALDHPELVRTLVVAAAAYRLSEHGRWVQRQLAAAIRDGQPRRAAAVGSAAMAAGAAGSRVLAAAGWVMGRRMFGDAGADLLAVLDAEDEFDVGERLGQLAAPTLIVGAERDRFYSPQLFRATADRIPGGRLILYPRIGHLRTTLHRRYARDVLAFLDET